MPSQDPIHLFVYGTLTDSERVALLTGKHFAAVRARLNGFARVESPLGYPFIIPRPGAVVHGLILCHVDLPSLLRLDDYEAEGDLYRRQVVEVEAAGTRLSAMTYVGYGIRASFTGYTTQASDLQSADRGRETTISTRHLLSAPFTDEH